MRFKFPVLSFKEVYTTIATLVEAIRICFCFEIFVVSRSVLLRVLYQALNQI